MTITRMEQITKDIWIDMSPNSTHKIISACITTLNSSVAAAERMAAHIEELEKENYELYSTIGRMGEEE